MYDRVGSSVVSKKSHERKKDKKTRIELDTRSITTYSLPDAKRQITTYTQAVSHHPKYPR
jgi:hypothetical protein